MPHHTSAMSEELSVEGHPAGWTTVEAFRESLSHCTADVVEVALKVFLEFRAKKARWPPGLPPPTHMCGLSASLGMPPPPAPPPLRPPPTLTLGLSEHLPQSASEHRGASTEPEQKRKRRSSEHSVGSVAGAGADETKKKKGRRKEIEAWNQEHFDTSARFLSALNLQIRDPHENFQSMLLEMKRVCPKEFGALEAYFELPAHARLKAHFWHSGFSVAQRQGVPYTSFMLPGGFVMVLHFPPDSLWEKKHSCSANALKDGFFNSTLNSLLKRLAGDMCAQYGVTGEEVLRWIDRAMFWEASFGFAPSNCHVVAAGGTKKEDGRQRVLPREWTCVELDEVEPMYLSLQQELVRLMPPRPFAVFGGYPADYARKKLIPVSQMLDVDKEHQFYFGSHPHYWHAFGCDTQVQVDTITKTSLAVMSSITGRDIPFVQGFHNLKSPMLGEK